MVVERRLLSRRKLALRIEPRGVLQLILVERHSHLSARGLRIVDRDEVDLLAEETRTNSGPLGLVSPLVHVQLHDRADLGAVTVDEFAAMPVVGVCHLGHLFSKAGIRE